MQTTLLADSPRSSPATRFARTAFALGITVILASGCSTVRSTFGLDKESPDEFTVVQRAPLAMPPDFGLRAPDPGATRPQDVTPTDRARQIVLESDRAASTAVPTIAGLSPAESALLKQAGATKVDPGIRREVDRESATIAANDKGWLDSLMFWKEPRDNTPLVDPEKEAQRIRENAALNQPVTTGETPIIRKKRSALFEF